MPLERVRVARALGCLLRRLLTYSDLSCARLAIRFSHLSIELVIHASDEAYMSIRLVKRTIPLRPFRPSGLLCNSVSGWAKAPNNRRSYTAWTTSTGRAMVMLVPYSPSNLLPELADSDREVGEIKWSVGLLSGSVKVHESRWQRFKERFRKRTIEENLGIAGADAFIHVNAA